MLRRDELAVLLVRLAVREEATEGVDARRSDRIAEISSIGIPVTDDSVAARWASRTMAASGEWSEPGMVVLLSSATQPAPP